ncbi:hypothetical protein Tco_1212299 [Tanacetum coccineum]
MNCPFAEAFTKTPLVVYQNFLREFWYTAIAYDPNPPTDDSEVRSLKEYMIKFSVMNGKRPLTLDFKTFTEFTGLDYAKGSYVSHPSIVEVKAELAKIVDNPNLLDRTPVLKTAFPIAWRILFTFVVQVLGGNYSSTKRKFNSAALCLLSSHRDKVLLGPNYTHNESFGNSPTIMSNYNFSKDPSKVTPIELTEFIGPEAPGSLPQKRKKPKSKKTPTGTKDELAQSDEEEVFAAGEDMDEDTQADEEEHKSPPTTDKSEPSPTQDTQESDYNSTSPDLKKYDNILPLTERQLVKYLRKVSRVLFNRLTEEQWAQHEEVVVSYADLKASIEGYYEENVNHIEQTDKVIDAAMNSLDKNSITRGDLLNALNGVTETLKAIQDAVKEDHVFNKKVIEATEAYTKNSIHLTELLTLIKNFDFQ